MFKLYKAKLRIGGSVLNEIRKDMLTSPEIEVLRSIHGNDAVVEIVDMGTVKRSDRAERKRLEDTYVTPSAGLSDGAAKRKRMLADLFGHESNALPKEVVVAVEAEDDEFEIPGEDAEVVTLHESEEAAPQPKAKGKERAPAFAE